VKWLQLSAVRGALVDSSSFMSSFFLYPRTSLTGIEKHID